MIIEQITDNALVTDKERSSYGIGRVEKIENDIVYVWFDEIETMLHYQQTELDLLEPLD